jgi:(p)ppGpp synthase/HD superfamily hydrolase
MKITPRLHKAIIFAAKAHDFSSPDIRHYRKGTEIPYITHPFSVASIVADYTDDEDTVIAALFHDIIEDIEVVGFGEKEIRDQFGDNVFELVMHCSQQIEDDGRNWKERKLAYLKHLADTPESALLIVTADKIHNLMSILEDFKSVGYEIFDRFNAEKEETLWFYQEVGKVIEASDLPVESHNTLKSQIDELEKIVKQK